MTPSHKSRFSNSTKLVLFFNILIINNFRRSSGHLQRVLSDSADECDAPINQNNQLIAFDNYLELREKLSETTERLDYVLNTNTQLMKFLFLIINIFLFANTF